MPSRRGFTLFEVLIVVTIITVVAASSIYFGIDSLRAYAFHSDRDLLVAALQHARAEAVGNICQTNSDSTCTDGRSHGVHVSGDTITIFQTSATILDYAHRDVSADAPITMSARTTFTGAPDVIFAQLSGDVPVPGSMTLTESSGKTTTITIGGEGQILWTN